MKKRRKKMENRPSLPSEAAQEAACPVEIERPMVGRGVRLQRRMSSLARYLVHPLGPDEEIVAVVVRYPEGVVERAVEPETV